MSKVELHFDVVIVGLGKTGMSCVRYLSQQGLKVAVTDSREIPPYLSVLKNEFPEVEVFTGDLNENLLHSTDQIVLSPGVSLQEPVIKDAIESGIPVCGDIEIFCQYADAPIIAITGSNGKSTVTTLVAEMIKQADYKVLAGGNLGTPALELLNEEKPDCYVLELSSFQLETTFSLNAHASCVLNITPDHMDRYNSLDDYVNAKKKIYSGQGLKVINKDDELVGKFTEDSGRAIYFSLNQPEANQFGVIKESDAVWLCRGESRIIKESDLLIKGEHNIANALAAMALASSFNVSESAMVDTLKSFAGLPHRCQKVTTINNVGWYNDSKATNVGASIASIKGLYRSGNIILIAGGDSKGAELSSLGDVVNKFVKHVILLGVDAQRLAHVFDSKVPLTYVSNIDEAVLQAHKIAEPGEIVLLAPACASLDMFKDYQQRGDAFVSAVKALEAG